MYMKAFTTWTTHTAPSGNRPRLRTEYQVGVSAEFWNSMNFNFTWFQFLLQVSEVLFLWNYFKWNFLQNSYWKYPQNLKYFEIRVYMLKSNWIWIVWITFNSNPLFPNEKRIWYQLQRFNIKMMRGFCVSCRCSVRPQKFHSAEQEIQFIVGAVFSFEAEWVKLYSP